jgi:hypothetical protein
VFDAKALIVVSANLENGDADVFLSLIYLMADLMIKSAANGLR